MSGSTHDGGEDSPGGVISGKASFAHTGSIVYNKGSNFVVTHFDLEDSYKPSLYKITMQHLTLILYSASQKKYSVYRFLINQRNYLFPL